MGGYVLVGFRRRDGSEYVAERWTNPLPSWMCNPTWWTGRLIDKYINAGESGDFPEEQLIHPSEYGVIFFDFQKKILFSRQDYTTPGRALCAYDNSPDAKEWIRLRDKGWIRNYKCWPISKVEERSAFEPQREMTSEEIKAFWARQAAHIQDPSVSVKNPKLAMVELWWHPPGWVFDVGAGGYNTRGYKHWAAVRQFLKDNEWKTEAWSEELVRQKYDLMSIEVPPGVPDT